MSDEADIDLSPALNSILAHDPEIQAYCEAVCKEEAIEIAGIAISIAPIEHGDYVASIHVDGSDVVADDFKSHWIEYGAERRNPPFQMRAPLRRAAEARGHKLSGGHR